MMAIIGNIVLAVLGILMVLFLLALCAVAVAGVIYLFGEQDDWVEIDDKQNRK